jgi:post-segregation antitoxin (ccd killing protein)
VQRISPVECAMMFGVAVIVTSLTVSALAAVVIDTAYQAIAERRWPAELPPMAVAIAVLAAVVGASIGSALG